VSIHILAFLILAIFIDVWASGAVIVAIATTEVLVWQRKAVLVFLKRIQENQARLQLDRERRRQMEMRPTENWVSHPSPASHTIRSSEVPPDTAVVDSRSPADNSIKTFRVNPRLKGNLPTGEVIFFGRGTRLDLGRGVLEDPLVYATNRAARDSFDASLIDGTLPVSPPGTTTRDQLPYWPSYYACTPAQRSRYLDWLVAGRGDPDMELGFVFIYFYGLERRIVIDRANFGTDFVPIIEELVRLCGIYNHSNSFRNYASSLLWLAVLLAGESQPLSEELLSRAVDATGSWSDDVLEMCLAYFHQRNLCLPGKLAFLTTMHNSGIPPNREKFCDLFLQRYEKQFGSGIMLCASTIATTLRYRPASGTLVRMAARDGLLQIASIHSVTTISSQFKPLVVLWEECIQELKQVNRAAKTGESGTLTTEPCEVATKDRQDATHPENDETERGKEAAASTAGESFLDWPAVEVIMQNTRDAFGILCKAIDVKEEDAENEKENTRVPAGSFESESFTSKFPAAGGVVDPGPRAVPQKCVNELASFPDLPTQYQPFLDAARKRSQWPSAEITDLAREHNLMLAGAIDAINEWWYDRHGDLLIKEGDPVTIHLELL
jgi:hypothetical protein